MVPLSESLTADLPLGVVISMKGGRVTCMHVLQVGGTCGEVGEQVGERVDRKRVCSQAPAGNIN